MSIEDLDAYVWSHLSPRRYIAGRALVSRLTRRVVRKFPHVTMSVARGHEPERIAREIASSIDRSERQNYRMGLFLTLVLSSIVFEIVKAVFAWWSRSASHKAQLLGWQQELRHDR